MTAARDVATVIVQDTVDGTNHRRGGPHLRLATWTRRETVHPAVMAAAIRACREGERVQVVSATEVITVPRRHA